MAKEATAPHDITINQEYANLVPPLSAEEYDGLKERIKQNGLIPIIINGQGVILDGHHRFRACQELGIEPKTDTMNFPDKLHEKMFVIDSNLQRRHLNNFQRTELALKSKSILEQIAKKNMSSAGKGVEIQTPLGRIDEQIGKHAGVGKDTVRRVQTIIEKAPEEVKQNARAGKMSINEAIEYIRRQEQLQQQEKNNKPHADRCGLLPKSEVASADLTPQEQQYVKATEDEYRRNELVDELLQLWTGKNKQQQDAIMLQTPKGSSWRKRLADASRDHMFTVFKRMTDSYVIGTVNDMRTVVEIASVFGDIGYEEQESRKRRSQMEGA
jgi:ParB-like chromosome segregation protein Spo0J